MCRSLKRWFHKIAPVLAGVLLLVLGEFFIRDVSLSLLGSVLITMTLLP